VAFDSGEPLIVLILLVAVMREIGAQPADLLLQAGYLTFDARYTIRQMVEAFAVALYGTADCTQMLEDDAVVGHFASLRLPGTSINQPRAVTDYPPYAHQTGHYDPYRYAKAARATHA